MIKKIRLKYYLLIICKLIKQISLKINYQHRYIFINFDQYSL